MKFKIVHMSENKFDIWINDELVKATLTLHAAKNYIRDVKKENEYRKKAKAFVPKTVYEEDYDE